MEYLRRIGEDLGRTGQGGTGWNNTAHISQPCSLDRGPSLNALTGT
jgi:hypothetical protein